MGAPTGAILAVISSAVAPVGAVAPVAAVMVMAMPVIVTSTALVMRLSGCACDARSPLLSSLLLLLEAESREGPTERRAPRGRSALAQGEGWVFCADVVRLGRCADGLGEELHARDALEPILGCLGLRKFARDRRRSDALAEEVRLRELL